MQEREVKLGAPRSFAMPELGGADDGFLAEPAEPRRLATTYYDTPDLRLARWGVSLRFREGEGWTVKLPSQDSGGPLLVRGEHVFDGPPSRPPAGAVDLVRVYVRSAPLAPVVRLRTVRRPIELRNAAGERLAEVVDDDVQVLDGRRIAARFRELEVELTDAALPDTVDKVLTRLHEAGAGDADPTPKYLRALGDRRLAGPELVLPELGRDASVEELLRYDLTASVLRLFNHEAGVRLGEDPEAVHQARVATRRLRSTLRTFSRLLDPDWTGHLRDELKELADRLGAVRDADVLLERLERKLATLTEADQRVGRRLLRTLADERDAARARLLEAMGQASYATLLDHLVEAARAPAVLPEAAGPAAAAVGDAVRRPWRKLRQTVEEAGPDPGDAELHQIRIRAKRVRYAAEAAAPVVGKPAAKLAKAAADLQTVLGDQHDAVVAEAWLRQAVSRNGRRRGLPLVAGQLIGLERADAAALRERWRPTWKALADKKLRAWV